MATYSSPRNRHTAIIRLGMITTLETGMYQGSSRGIRVEYMSLRGNKPREATILIKFYNKLR